MALLRGVLSEIHARVALIQFHSSGLDELVNHPWAP